MFTNLTILMIIALAVLFILDKKAPSKKSDKGNDPDDDSND